MGKSGDQLKGMRLKRGEGIAGWIAESGQAVIIEDVRKDHPFTGRLDSATGFQTQSIIGVPLKSRGVVFGVIELVNKLSGEAFSALELKTLPTIADFGGIAIERGFYFHPYAVWQPSTLSPRCAIAARWSAA